MATWALVSAILAWVVCPVILAVVALVLASKAKNKISASGGALGGEGLATAATVIATVHLAIVGIAIVGIVAIASLGTSGSSKFNNVGSNLQTILPLFR